MAFLVKVKDSGYTYSINKNIELEIISSIECDIIESSFVIPLPDINENKLKLYVLSGFVFGKFSVKYIEDECYFVKRLLLTLFRNFLSVLYSNNMQ